MLRHLVSAAALFVLVLPGSAHSASAGADLAFDGGSARERAQVRTALRTSSFDWGLVPERVTVHIGAYGTSRSAPGHISGSTPGSCARERSPGRP
jgi:hypothetical protein